jgi:hypothetical protein
VRQRLGDKPVDPFEMVLAHIEEALDEDDATTRKAAFLVTALVHAPDMMEPARRYYRTLLDPLLSKSGDAHDVRHALLAMKDFSCSGDWASSGSRRTSRNPSCSTRAISLSRSWPSVGHPPATLLDQNDALNPTFLFRCYSHPDTILAAVQRGRQALEAIY